MKCLGCDGEGELLDDMVETTRITYACGYCGGTGTVSLWRRIFWWLTGEFKGA